MKKESHSILISIITLILVLFLIIITLINTSSDKDYNRFLTILGNYDEVVKERNNCFKIMYDVWADSDDFRSLKVKESNSLSFILWRLRQNEPLTNIESELIVREIQCISYMNKLCELALTDKRAFEILRLKEPYELYFYNEHRNQVKELYYMKVIDKQKIIKLELDSLNQENIRKVYKGEYFYISFLKRSL